MFTPAMFSRRREAHHAKRVGRNLKTRQLTIIIVIIITIIIVIIIMITIIIIVIIIVINGGWAGRTPDFAGENTIQGEALV